MKPLDQCTMGRDKGLDGQAVSVDQPLDGIVPGHSKGL